MSLESFRRSSRSRLNYTDRKTLRADAVAISVDAAASPLRIRLNELKIDPNTADDAEITIEAYRSSSGHYERLGLGQVKPLKSVGAGSAWIELRNVPEADGLRFRVKITARDTGRLLAEADGLRSIEDQAERDIDELFPLRPKDLKGELWRVEFTSEGPELWIEKSLVDHGVALWKSPAFCSLALPQALRVVAERLVRERELERDWHGRWRTFLCELAPSFADLAETDDDEDDSEEKQVDSAQLDATLCELAQAFARKFDLTQAALAALQEGDKE